MHQVLKLFLERRVSTVAQQRTQVEAVLTNATEHLQLRQGMVCRIDCLPEFGKVDASKLLNSRPKCSLMLSFSVWDQIRDVFVVGIKVRRVGPARSVTPVTVTEVRSPWRLSLLPGLFLECRSSSARRSSLQT